MKAENRSARRWLFESTQQADPCLELRSPDYRLPKPHKASSRAGGGCGRGCPHSPQSSWSPHSFSEDRFQRVCPLMASHALFVSPKTFRKRESPFPPTSILFLLACIFLSKLLAASALWAAAWHGRNNGHPRPVDRTVATTQVTSSKL